MAHAAQAGIMAPVPRDPEGGIVDALFQMSKPVTGAYFWCPALRDGRLDLQVVGL